MIGLNLNTEYMTILLMPKELSVSWDRDLNVSCSTLNAVLKKIPALSIQATGLCSAWVSHLAQSKLWYLARTPLTIPALELYSGKFYQELSLLLTMESLTLRDFVTWRVHRNCGLIRCLPPIALMSVLDTMDSNHSL